MTVVVRVVFAIVAVNVDCDIGAANGRQPSVSAAEYTEVRILVVGVRLLPFVGYQQFVRSHAFLHHHGCKSGAVGCACGHVAVGVFVCAHVAGKITAAIDVVGIQKLAVGIELRSFVYHILSGRLVALTVDVGVPNVEDVFNRVPHLEPYHID